MTAAVFLDRDGVIIENRADYVKSWSEVEVLPGAVDALQRLSAAGWPLVVVSNQSAVGRGIVTLAQVEAIQARLEATLAAEGVVLAGSYFCPHHPEAGCGCRKPAPGLLHRAAAELALDIAASWLVGDALTDLQAAAAGGARGVLVRTGRGAAQAARLTPAEAERWPVVADLTAAAEWIMAQERARQA